MGRKPKSRALVQFYHQLAGLIDSGIPLLRCLSSMEYLTHDRALRTAVTAVRQGIERGESFATSLARHPHVFDNTTLSSIAAGESGGRLDVALQRVAVYVERREASLSAVRSAMVYPAILLGTALASVLALVVLVIPTFQKLFEATGASLPLPTQILVSATHLILGNPALLVTGFVGLAIGGVWLLSLAPVQHALDRIALQIPLVRGLVVKVGIGRFSRTLASLLGAGVPILEGIDTAARTTGNSVLEATLSRVRRDVEMGWDLRGALGRQPILPPLLGDMAGVGEEAGRLDEMMAKVADFYEQEADNEIKAVTKMLEPAFTLAVGVTLAFIVAAMYLPIFDAVIAAGQ